MCIHARMTQQYFNGSSILDTQIVEPLYNAYDEYLDNHSRKRIIGLENGFYHKGNYYFYGKHFLPHPIILCPQQIA